MSRRGSYEFPKYVKEEAKRKWRRDNPDREDEPLEVHHQIPVKIAKKLKIPPYLVRVSDNAIAVTKDEHKEIHENELTLDEYKILAQALLGWTRNLL